VTKDAQDKANALSKNIQFGAFALIVSGLGVLLFVVVSILMQTQFATTAADDEFCEEPVEVVVTCDESTDYSCEVPIVFSTPEVTASASPKSSVIPTPSDSLSTEAPANPPVLLEPDANLEYAQYSTAPKVGTKIGTLTLKEIKKTMPIIEGTSLASLKKGAGHFVESVLPGMKDNTVISGHRETVFKSLGEVKTGHKAIITTSAGTFTYQVTGTRIVDADDRTVIVPTKEAVLTMTTCYPFKAYGPKPQRYIVSAQLISSKLESP
jgi:sortase A